MYSLIIDFKLIHQLHLTNIKEQKLLSNYSSSRGDRTEGAEEDCRKEREWDEMRRGLGIDEKGN